MRLSTSALILALFAAGCGGEAAESTSTTVAPTTTTSNQPESTTSVPATTTTTSALDALGYPISDEWVVETIVTNLSSGTGGLAVDADGVMYQANFGYAGNPGNNIYRIEPDGTAEVFVESDDMRNLTMTTFGADGHMYQSSYGSGLLFRIGEDGTLETIAEGLRGPAGVVVLEDGTVFVETYDAGILHRILPGGEVEDWVARHPGFNGINGLTVGPDGTLYVVNHRDGGMFAVDQDGNVTDLHRFPRATSHVAYLDGSLFVTSRGGFVVFRYDLETGDVEIIAGNGEPGEADGRGSESSFGRPNAITVGPDGALYINHGTGRENGPVHIKKITHQP